MGNRQTGQTSDGQIFELGTNLTTRLDISERPLRVRALAFLSPWANPGFLRIFTTIDNHLMNSNVSFQTSRWRRDENMVRTNLMDHRRTQRNHFLDLSELLSNITEIIDRRHYSSQAFPMGKQCLKIH